MRNIMAACIAAALPGCALASSLVVNGDFGSDTFSGWQLSGNTHFSRVITERVFGRLEHAAVFGPHGSSGTLSQMLNTVAGQSYRLSFDLKSPLASPREFMHASFGGQLLFSSQDSAFGWEHLSFTVQANAATSLLSFNYRDDPAFMHLANISVVPVPEPESAALLGLGLCGVLLARRRRGWSGQKRAEARGR